jgi:Mce-associated membrane protein
MSPPEDLSPADDTSPAEDASPAPAESLSPADDISPIPAESPSPPEDQPARRLLAAAVALFVLAAAAAGWFGWSWYRAADAGQPSYSQARDRALQEGEQAVQNFNTLDYRHIGQGIGLWLQSSTGSLHSQIQAGRAQFSAEVRTARTITTARVLDGALTALNTGAGTARIIVALQITVIPAKGPTVTKQNRLEATLTRTGSGWKVSALGQVPITTATAGS